jgi:hypothetical protein
MHILNLSPCARDEARTRSSVIFYRLPSVPVLRELYMIIRKIMSNMNSPTQFLVSIVFFRVLIEPRNNKTFARGERCKLINLFSPYDNETSKGEPCARTRGCLNCERAAL